MAISSGQLAYMIKELGNYVKSTEGIDRIIITHSLAAAAAAVASGWIPGAGGAIATAIGMGFTLTMYIRLAHECDIKLRKNILKAIASVVIAEIAAYLGVVIAAETILTLFPGLGSVGGAIIAGVINFAMVYIAGLLFIKMLVSIFKAGKNVDSMNTEELKEAMKKEATRDNISSAYKEAKKVYKSAKDDKSYDTSNIKPEE